MEVLYATNKGRLMDTMEKFYIYKEAHSNNQINDKNTVKPNIIFNIIVEEGTSRAHTSPKLCTFNINTSVFHHKYTLLHTGHV